MEAALSKTASVQIPAPPPQLRPLTRMARAMLCLAWMSPIVIVPYGWFFLMGALERIVHPDTLANVMLGWISFGASPIALWSLIIVVLGCYAGCFEMFRRVERWRNPLGAVGRALLRMPVIIGINVASAFGIAWVAQVVANMLT